MTKTEAQVVKDGYAIHHTARKQGYVSRKSTTETRKALPYTGRYGNGYTVDLPAWDSTRYCVRAYYIRKG